MTLRKFILVLLLPCFSAFAAGNERIINFAEAKRLLSLIHQDHPFTLYCGCKYQGKSIDLKSCGYKVYKDPVRAARLEWEHVVPAHAFGQSFKEWRIGSEQCRRGKKKKKSYRGRSCAQKNPLYARMEADLYNLQPEIGELNGLRSNFSMAAFPKGKLNSSSITFGNCQAIIAGRKFEPMDQAKGVVARTYLYMDGAYPGRGIISKKNNKLFAAWNKLYPVTEWECRRAKKIADIQGNSNPVLQAACNLGKSDET